jgi:aminoglycoside phosphotransferase (APT) family kinase protein
LLASVGVAHDLGVSKPWRSSHSLDATTAAAIVAEQFPDLAPATAAYLDEGWDSVAFEVNRTWIFRFPKRADVVAFHDVERALLPRLAGTLPLPVPRPTRDGRPTPVYPFRFLGYERIEGTPAIRLPLDAVDLDACGERLGEFLTALHRFPTAEARAAGVRDGPTGERLAAQRIALLARMPAMRSALPAPLERRSLRFLEGPLAISPPREVVLTHNDLCDGHFLVDVETRRVAGVIDWGDVAVGDAAVDFAGLWQWLGEPLVDRALRAYGGRALDDAGRDRARAVSLFMSFSTLWYGVEGNRPEFVASGLRSLERDLPA